MTNLVELETLYNMINIASKITYIVLVAAMLFSITGLGCNTNANSRASNDLWTAIDKDDAEAIRGIRDAKSILNKTGLLNQKTPLQYALEQEKVSGTDY